MNNIFKNWSKNLDACSPNLKLENLVNFDYVGGQPAVAFDSSTQSKVKTF